MPAVMPADVDRRLRNEDRVRFDFDLWTQLLQKSAGAPVSRRTPAVKKSSGRKYEGARANTRHASGDGFAQMQPVQQSRTEYHLPQPVFAPARQHDRIEIRRQTLQTGGLTETSPPAELLFTAPPAGEASTTS